MATTTADCVSPRNHGCLFLSPSLFLSLLALITSLLEREKVWAFSWALLSSLTDSRGKMARRVVLSSPRPNSPTKRWLLPQRVEPAVAQPVPNGGGRGGCWVVAWLGGQCVPVSCIKDKLWSHIFCTGSCEGLVRASSLSLFITIFAEEQLCFSPGTLEQDGFSLAHCQ